MKNILLLAPCPPSSCDNAVLEAVKLNRLDARLLSAVRSHDHEALLPGNHGLSIMNFVKIIHMTTAFASIAGFTARGIWAIRDSRQLQKKWVKITPHINDTIFLLSGITLTIQIGQYPFVNAWLTVKVLGLLVYILLGLVVLRFAKSKPIKSLAFGSAIAVFIYIVLVAQTKNPLLSFHSLIFYL